MAIRLEKGQKINLEKNNGSRLTEFCVGCNWGAITSSGFLGFSKKKFDVDLDLSCIMIDKNGRLCDHLYSPLYRTDFLASYGMPPGKIASKDKAIQHSGDDIRGDQNGDDGLDNEILTVDLKNVSQDVDQIFFFLNCCGKEDFSRIPYASIRMYEGTPRKVIEVFAAYDVAADPKYKGMTALVMGKLYRHNEEWKFAAIGDAYPDPNLCETIKRIISNYVKD